MFQSIPNWQLENILTKKENQADSVEEVNENKFVTADDEKRKKLPQLHLVLIKIKMWMLQDREKILWPIKFYYLN